MGKSPTKLVGFCNIQRHIHELTEVTLWDQWLESAWEMNREGRNPKPKKICRLHICLSPFNLSFLLTSALFSFLSFFFSSTLSCSLPLLYSYHLLHFTWWGTDMMKKKATGRKYSRDTWLFFPSPPIHAKIKKLLERILMVFQKS